MVESDGRAVRHRRGVGDCAVVRAGAALAAVHGGGRAADRPRLRARGICLLRRSDFPRLVSLRLGPAVAARPLVVRRGGRGERRRIRRARALGERLDAGSGRLSARGGRGAGGDRPGRGALQPGVAADGVPLDAVDLSGGRVRRGRDLRVGDSPRPPCPSRPLPSPRPDHGDGARCGVGDPAAAVRRPARQAGPSATAGEAGGDGRALPDGTLRAAAHRRGPGSRRTGHPLRARSAVRSQLPRRERFPGRSRWPRSVSPRPVAERGRDPPGLSSDGRLRRGNACRRRLVRARTMAAAPDSGPAVEPRAVDGTRRLRTARVRGPGSRLGRYRGGPAAVGDLRDPSHRGRGHAGRGRRRLTGGVHPALRHAAVHRRRVPAPARGRAERSTA